MATSTFQSPLRKPAHVKEAPIKPSGTIQEPSPQKGLDEPSKEPETASSGNTPEPKVQAAEKAGNKKASAAAPHKKRGRASKAEQQEREAKAGVNIWLPQELHKELRRFAISSGQPLRAIVIDAIARHRGKPIHIDSSAEGTVPVSVLLPHEQRRELRLLALEKGTTMQDLLLGWVTDYWQHMNTEEQEKTKA